MRFVGKLQSNTVFDFFRMRSGTLWVNCGTILSRVPFELAPTHNHCAPSQLSPMYISECPPPRLTPYRAASGHSTRQILGGTGQSLSCFAVPALGGGRCIPRRRTRHVLTDSSCLFLDCLSSRWKIPACRTVPPTSIQELARDFFYSTRRAAHWRPADGHGDLV